MMKMRVGVLRGGPSAEYDVSLKSGQAVLDALPAEQYDLADIYIDRSGTWHFRGRPVEPHRAFDQIDVIFNALHGRYGEDGTVQRLLDTHGVPYTGSDALGSAIGMHKALAKGLLKDHSVLLAHHRVLVQDDLSEAFLRELWTTFPQPSVVKPLDGGSSVATAVVRTFDELLFTLLEAFKESEKVLIEQYLKGREATVAVVEGFRGEPYYALPPIEIVPTKNSFFDYAEKYAGFAREICPAPFPRETTFALEEAARDIHQTLGLRDYSRSDFIVRPEGLFFLEVNTLPGLTPASLVPKAVESVGGNLSGFLAHLVDRAAARI